MDLRQRFQKITGARGSLRHRSFGATLWSLGGVGIGRSLSLVSNLVMTRILVPEAFGLMAMVITVMAMVNMISDLGIKQSITRDERGEDLHFLRVAWTVQIFRSTVVAIVVVLVAIAIGALGPRLAAPDSVYADPRLPWLIAASTIAILLRGLESPGMHRAERRLDIRKITIIEAVNQAITLAIMVTLAQFNATVWVLLWGLLIGAAQRLIWTHTAFRDLPMRPAWDREIVAGLWTFGRWLIVGSVAGFVVNQGDRFLMASLLDSTSFGLYVIASLWLQPGMMIIEKFKGQVLFPGLSEIVRGKGAVLPTLTRVRRLFDWLTILGFLSTFLFGAWLIRQVYTPEYAGAGIFLTVLAFRFLAIRHRPLGMALLAEGNSRVTAMSVIFSAVVMAVSVPLAGLFAGPLAATMAVALSPLGGAFAFFFRTRDRYPDYDIVPDIAITAMILAAGIVVAFSIEDGRFQFMAAANRS